MVDEWKIFENVQNEIHTGCKRDKKLIERHIYKLVEKLNHEKASLEFERSFKDCVGEIIPVNDPLGCEEVDTVIDATESARIFKIKIQDICLKVNLKVKTPTAKYGTFGISSYHYNKYLDKNIYLIISIPNIYYYQSNREYLEPYGYKFFLLNLKRTEPCLKYNGYYYFHPQDLFDFDLIKKGQTQLIEYVKSI